jgi:hypothetical protein
LVVQYKRYGEDMSDILDEAQSLLQCKSCPWYKACVLPMRFTEEDLKKQLESTMPGSSIPGTTDYGMQQLLAGMAAAAQNTLLEGCPIFINRLRTNPKLAERIKKIMQEWSAETETDNKTD